MAKAIRPVTSAGNRTRNTKASPRESPSEEATSMAREDRPPRARLSARPSAPLHERDEAHRSVLGALVAPAAAAHDDQALVAVAHRRDQPAALGELLEQRGRHWAVDRRGDVDRVERRVGGAAA